MKKLLLIALMLISGCAVPITAVPVNGIERSAALPLTDLRPETEKQRALFSANVFSDAYGTFRMGDDLVTPPPTRLFQHRASEKFGVDRPEPLTITLHHLVVYRNMEAELKGAAMEGALATPSIVRHVSRISDWRNRVSRKALRASTRRATNTFISDPTNLADPPA